MKRFLSIVITAILVFSLSTGAFAQTVDNDFWGIGFTLSDDWMPDYNDPNLLAYYHNTDAFENIEIFYQSANVVTTIQEAQGSMNAYFDKIFSNEQIAQNLSAANKGVSMTVMENYQNRRYETYNNTVYYRGEKLYMASAEGFKDQYFYITVFSTVQNGKLYVITYDCINDRAPHFADVAAMLDTITYANAAPAVPDAKKEPEIGDVVGYALKTDIRATINSHQIPSFNVDGYTYIVAEDLRFYGFAVNYDDSTRALAVNRDYTLSIVSKNYTKPTVAASEVGLPEHPILFTDIVTYLDGQYTGSYNIDGQTIIRFDSLSPYGFVSYDDTRRTISVELYEAN